MIIVVRIIAIAHLVGASAAMFAVGPSLIAAAQHAYNWPIVAAVSAYLIAGLLSGVWLWTGQRRGYLTGIAVQIVQIPVLLSSAFSVKAFLGAAATLFLYGRPGYLSLQYGGEVVLTYDSASMQTFVGINLLAVVAAGFLIWTYNRRHAPTTSSLVEEKP